MNEFWHGTGHGATAGHVPQPDCLVPAIGSGPCAATASCKDGPATYVVTSQGVGASRSASITGAVNAPLTR